MTKFLLRCQTGDYLGEGGTLNTDRSYAVRFDSKEEAFEAVRKIPADWRIEEELNRIGQDKDAQNYIAHLERDLQEAESELERHQKVASTLLMRALAYLPVPATIMRDGTPAGVKVPDVHQQPAVERLRQEIRLYLRVDDDPIGELIKERDEWV